MRKAILVVALLALMLPAAAQDMGGCMLEPPENAAQINMIGWTYPIIDFYADELEACNAVDNVEVNTQLLSSGAAQEQLSLALGAGGTSPYDIIMVTQGTVNSYTAEGWMMPLNDLIDKYEEAYHISDIGGLEDMSIDGVIYALPMELNTRHLFYRPDILEAHGVAVPETWDDVIDACGVLYADESTVLPFTIQLHAGWAWRLEFSDLLLGFGGHLLNEDNTPAFNGDEGVMALEKLVEITDACMGAEGLTYSIDDSQIGIATGELAMVFTWASRAAAMDDPDFSDYVGGIEFAPAPRALADGPYAATGGTGAGLGIPANIDDDPDLVFQVLMEALDVQSQVGASGYGVISRNSVAAEADARYLPAVFETINGGVEGSSVAAIGAVLNGVLGQWLPQIVTGDMSAADLLDAAAEAYTAEATTQGFIEG
ncbi:MAG: extracellular solute-binding protein [Chloroflexota bacterium]|nr:extracellular solute-binding protein [Chloroflexota bacterium]MDE2908775.1 extracellular solute-binding protein [Chloroflexota bacterium]